MGLHTNEIVTKVATSDISYPQMLVSVWGRTRQMLRQNNNK